MPLIEITLMAGKITYMLIRHIKAIFWLRYESFLSLKEVPSAIESEQDKRVR